MEAIKHEKGTVQVDQVIFTTYKLSSTITLGHRKNGDTETFEINKAMSRDELYALKAVIDSLLTQETDKK